MGEILVPKTSMCEDDFGDQESESSSVENGNCRGSSKSYQCSQCSKTFRSNDTLLRHKISHSGAKPFSCDICKKGLSSAVSLKEHKAKHNKQNLYDCSICHRGFRQNSSYRRHLITHSNALPHECAICKRRFAQRSYLRSHTKIHTGEKPYLCDPPCGKSFAHLSDLKRHRVLHTGKRPYKCDICGSSFADRSSRRRHQKDHENKPWNHACNLCRSSFKKSAQLEKHMSKAHGITSLLLLSDVQNLKNSGNKSSIPTQLCGSNLSVGAVEVFPARNDITLMALPESNMQRSHETVPLEIPVADFYNQEDHSQQKECSGSSSQQITELCETNKGGGFCSLSEKQNSNMEEKSIKEGCTEAIAMLQIPSVQKDITPSSDYVLCPDFNSQDYFEWLTNFVSLCKLLSHPVENEVFIKMNQVHKSIIDCLSNPSEFMCNKTNYKSLMQLSQDLFRIISGHLNFICSQLPEEQ